jgi:transcriptional regulator with XRE-family HTH domain
MNIKARIEQVIAERGLTKKEVAEKMGKFNQAFNSLLTNPKWETIELVAKALEMNTCEMLFGIKPEQEKASADALAAAQPAAEPRKEEYSDAGASELPFKNDQPSVPASLICPHCGGAFVVEVRAK